MITITMIPAFMECKLYLRSYAKAYTRYFILCNNKAGTVLCPFTEEKTEA